MTDQKKTRRQKLEEFLAANPNDAFSRYGLALECINSGDFASAEANFRLLLQSNPDYVPGYQMYAQTLAQTQSPRRGQIHTHPRLRSRHSAWQSACPL